jgi:hypothetical protein
VEGDVALFDDSYEHEVWNETTTPRLVLIVDLWHPMLDTDEKRLATLDPERADRYRRIVDQRVFESALPAPSQPVRPRALLQQLAGVHEQLIGAAGMRRLLDCLAATAALEEEGDEAQSRRAEIVLLLHSELEPPLPVAIAEPVVASLATAGAPFGVAVLKQEGPTYSG